LSTGAGCPERQRPVPAPIVPGQGRFGRPDRGPPPARPAIPVFSRRRYGV